ncbi:MAG: hypothetical protein ACRD8U_18080 [Pyrinomonadaceae bacterium]
MAKEKRKDQNREEVGIPEKDQRKAKAMAAGASFGKSERDEQNLRQDPMQPESAGQGGGIQGTGQRNPTPNKDKDAKDIKSGTRDETKSRKGAD